MHYLQNSWFLTQWGLLFFLLTLSLVFIAYINNKSKLLKRASLFLSMAVIFNAAQFFNSSTNILSTPKSSIVNEASNVMQVRSQSSTMSKVFSILMNIMKDKIQD